MIAVNMNECCKVKLTDFGVKVLTKHYEQVPTSMPQPDVLGYYKFLLWQLFQIFGSTMHISMSEVPFEKNEFYFN
ncbi:hypothetical protein [Brevibacillus brevis]|uniref:hypothetical protein n=1 Tax=Brevibacillus brevis TaxID=1393 RepID=UPI00165D48CD|nr:hypothetical protein [Brevibacillus brevis]